MMKYRNPLLFNNRRIAIVTWSDPGEIGEAIALELNKLGYEPVYFAFDAKIPNDVDMVFSFGPYGPVLPYAKEFAYLPAHQQPTFIHWNSEGLPDLRMPWPVTKSLGLLRSRLGESQVAGRRLLELPLLSRLEARFHRFRYVGDYYRAYQQNWLHAFFDISAVYTRLFCQHGLPTGAVPYGASPLWYADLNLERDIDVLWLGSHATRRRSRLLHRLRRELQAHGVELYLVDNIEHPFVYRDERTELLNRAKITLNLTRTWYDDNTLRFCMAAANRSLIVSEPLLPHCPSYKPGIHYISAPVASLTQQILYYLAHDQERLRVAENGYRLVTTQLTMANSVKTIMTAATEMKPSLRTDCVSI